jgi:hypothetical protein
MKNNNLWPDHPVDSLSKENFWNALKVACPNIMDVFGKWIDSYKSKVAWDQIFHTEDCKCNGYTKYHDIPIEMQIGIFIKFTRDCQLPHFNMVAMWNNIPRAMVEWFEQAEVFLFTNPNQYDYLCKSKE